VPISVDNATYRKIKCMDSSSINYQTCYAPCLARTERQH
jgi:hypothetical protein